MAAIWRLIRQGDLDAALNMAVDEALLLSHAEGKSPPTIRFYGWDRPSISLGYFQDSERGLNPDAIRARGLQLVRRLTGGRAVLHGHDLTFSIVVGSELLPADRRSVPGSHSWLMQGIIGGLRAMGLDARLGRSQAAPSGRSADCFAHIASCDVTVGDRKVAGSAQARKQGIILEQGSIPLQKPAVNLEDVFGRLSPEAGESAVVLDRDALESAIVGSFAHMLGAPPFDGELSPLEVDKALSLRSAKYDDPEWTLRAYRPVR